MKRNIRIMVLALFASMLSEHSYAQVKLTLDLQSDNRTYTVSALPERTYEFPKEIIGSMQVTLRVSKSASFSPGTIFSEIPNVVWMKNNTLEDLNMSDKYNYYTYGVEPIGKGLQFNEGDEVKLFSFTQMDEKQIDIELLETSDPVILLAEQTLSIDIANNVSMTTTMGVDNVYKGNLTVNEGSLKKNEFDKSFNISSVFPNPGKDKIQLSWSNFNDESLPETFEIHFIEVGNGREQLVQPLKNYYGSNTEEIDISSLKFGPYIMKISERGDLKNDGIHFQIKE